MTATTGQPNRSPTQSGWQDLWRKEDWWAIWIGLAVVLAGCVLFWNGGNLRWLAVLPPRWSSFSQVVADLATNWARYVAQFTFWLTAFSIALLTLGYRVRAFAAAFALLYVASYVIFVIGQWEGSVRYNLEPPLVALFLGLLLANTVGLPRQDLQEWKVAGRPKG